MERRIQSRLYCFGSGASDDDSGGSAAEDIVTMGLGAPAQGGNVSGREEIAMNNLIDEMDTEDRMARDRVNPMTTGYGPSAANPDVPANFFVGAPNLPPPVITGQGREVFDSTSGKQIVPDASYFGDLGGSSASMVPLNSAPVPTPPPPRFQTNAEKDFYENLAAQGDAAMNQFRSEVRNLDNRGLLGDFIARGIGNRGVPNFNPDMPQGSQIRGVTNTRFVDLPFVGTVPMSTYTGLDNPNAVAEERDEETVPPVVNPLTGRSQCPDGYVFDEDLQACRLKGRSNAGTSNDGTSSPPSDPGDMFYRRTSLDDAPANLPSGFDFDAANRRFTQGFAVRPSFFQRPPDLTGFTLL
tara:strand:+ start:436 stop:1497 length:1062 start_codon:yes stop_codon:yes gene_type:complete